MHVEQIDSSFIGLSFDIMIFQQVLVAIVIIIIKERFHIPSSCCCTICSCWETNFANATIFTEKTAFATDVVTKTIY